MSRAYLLAMACGAFLAATIVAGSNWVVDPFAIYASARIEGFNALKPALKTRSRIFKTVTVASGQPEALIVGTSRAETALDPAHPSFGGLRAFNAAIAGQDYRETLALVRAAAHGGRLRKVVAVLDFEVANALYAGPVDFTWKNYEPSRKASLAFSLDSLRQSLATVRLQDRDALASDQALWLPDGRFVFPAPRGGNRAAALVSESEYLYPGFLHNSPLRYSSDTGLVRPLEDVRKLIAFAHAAGLEFAIVIAPSHARQLETLAAAGLWNAWESWKRDLVSINADEARRAGRDAVPIWDFSGYNEVTTEPFPPLGDPRPMRWYYESSHFTPAAGARLLDRVSGKPDPAFGVLLTPANVEAILRETRDARTRWREEHAMDASEIAALARDPALLRQLERSR